MDARLRDETRWELIPQLLDDARRPHRVEALPRRFLAYRRPKMIAKWHGDLLHRHCITSDLAASSAAAGRSPAATLPPPRFRESFLEICPAVDRVEVRPFPL